MDTRVVILLLFHLFTIIITVSAAGEMSHEQGCPANCTCEVAEEYSGLSILCSAVPLSIPDGSHLTIREATIEKLQSSDLSRIRNAESLNLNGLSIGTIDAGNVTLAKLRRLSLSGNRIIRISNNTFRWCSSLEWLDLSDNRIKNVSANAFVDLIALKNLSLSRNKLETLETSELPADLIALNLSHNLMHDEQQLPQSSSLQSLDLCGNNLRTFTVEPRRAPLLSELCLGDEINSLRVVTAGGGMSALTTLHVIGKAENGSEAVLNEISGLKNLSILRISHFNFTSITPDMLAGFARLKELHLDNVGTKFGFTNDALAMLAPRLRVLDLGGSQELADSLVQVVNGSSTATMLPNLRSLSIADTGTSVFPAGWLSMFAPNVTEIDLSSNRLTCDSSLAGIMALVVGGKLRLVNPTQTICATPTSMTGLQLGNPRVVVYVLESGARDGSHSVVLEYLESLGVTPTHLLYIILGLIILALALLMALLIVCHMRRRWDRRDGSRSGCCGSTTGSDGQSEGFMMRADSEYTFDNFTLSDIRSESMRAAAAAKESAQARARKNSNRK